MAYDEHLAERIRRALGPHPGVVEKKMFGGTAFMLDGKMFVGVVKDDLMVRVGPDGHAAAVARPHARTMDFTGRPMIGYVYVGPGGTGTDLAVEEWVKRGTAFVATLASAPKPDRKRATPAKARGEPPKRATRSAAGKKKRARKR